MVFFVINKKKKKRLDTMGISAGKVLQPVSAYRPDTRLTATPAIGTGAQLARPQVAGIRPLVSPPVTQPTAQLPPIQPAAQTQRQEKTKLQEQRVGIDSRLSPQQKIAFLEERLVLGEIDQNVYQSLKAKFEMEAKPYQPLPQLLPPQPPEQPSDAYQQPPPEEIQQTQPPQPPQVPQPQAQIQQVHQPQIRQPTIEPQSQQSQIKTKRNQINSQNSD
jgi:hypothetical protein